MKKRVNRQKKNYKLESNLKKTLGLLSTGAIAASLFMGYNRLTGNAISAVEKSTTFSLGGIVLFILGLVGVFAITKD